MSWDDPSQYSAWETLVLGPYEFPGLASAPGGVCSRLIEVLKSKEADGAPLQDNGYEPEEIDIMIRYLSAAHARMREIVTNIHPRTRGPDRAPLAIQLEQINFLGITQVSVVKVSAPRINDGVAEFFITVIEDSGARKKADKRSPRPAGKRPEPTSYLDPEFTAFTGGEAEGIEEVENVDEGDF